MTLSPHEESWRKTAKILAGIRHIVGSMSQSPQQTGQVVGNLPATIDALTIEIDRLEEGLSHHASDEEAHNELIRRLQEILTTGQPSPGAQISSDGRKIITLANQRVAQAQLGYRLAHRNNFNETMAETMRDLISTKQLKEARSLALSMMSNQHTEETGHLCAAIVASKSKLPDLAASYFQRVQTEIAIKYAPIEWYDVQFDRDPTVAFEHFRLNLNAYTNATWSSVIHKCFTHGMLNEAQHLSNEFLEVRSRKSTNNDFSVADIEFIDDFFSARTTSRRPSSVGSIGSPRIGVWETRQPDITGPSADLGIHLDTVVLLSRLQTFGILSAANSELETVIGEIVATGSHGNGPFDPQIQVTSIPRYRPSEADISAPTWTVFHGTFGEPVFGVAAPFPDSPKIRPIFFGFQLHDLACNDPQMMDLLKSYGPVGCKDWTSTFALLGQGIDAFYSGALASLAAAPCSASRSGSAVSSSLEGLSGLISPGASPGELAAQQKSARLRSSSLGENLQTATKYLRAISSAVRISTPHLETSLAGSAMGVTVDFTPPGIRKKGAAVGREKSASEMVARPDSAEELLNATLCAISRGEDESSVYDVWRQLATPHVAEAKRRFRAVPSLPKPSFNVQAVVSALQSQTIAMGPSQWRNDKSTVHVAMACDENLFGQLCVTIESVLRGTRRNLRLHLLSRGLSRNNFEYIASLYPTIAFDFIPCDGINYGNVLSTAKHLTVSAIDRLLLPSLLDTIPQLVYVDVDLMVLSDLGQLFDLKMASIPVAACSASAAWSKSGFGHLLAVAQRLDDVRAAELKHLMLHSQGKDFIAFNSGVMVLNLAAMRRDDFCEKYLGCPGYFDMNDQDVLYIYTGRKRRVLHPDWNCIPSHVYIHRPRIVHWAGPAKPWHGLHMPYQNAWLRLVDEVASKAVSRSLDPLPISRLASPATT